jgi:DNA invertase Pin-like site-specific DNA recombinase
MTKYGYVRVSSLNQKLNFSLENQTDALKRASVPECNIIREVISGSLEERPELNKLESKMNPGDELYVAYLDRYARNTVDALMRIQKLNARNISFIALDIGYCEDPAMQKMTLSIFLSLAQFENERRRDRQMQGIQKAKFLNKYPGRKTVINDKFLKSVKHYSSLDITSKEIALILKVSLPTIYKAKKILQKK